MSKGSVDRGGVAWHLPKPSGGYYARPFARTPVGALSLIELLAEDGASWATIAAGINFDPEAQAVAQAFVDAGFGDERALDRLEPHLLAAQ